MTAPWACVRAACAAAACGVAFRPVSSSPRLCSVGCGRGRGAANGVRIRKRSRKKNLKWRRDDARGEGSKAGARRRAKKERDRRRGRETDGLDDNHKAIKIHGIKRDRRRRGDTARRLFQKSLRSVFCPKNKRAPRMIRYLERSGLVPPACSPASAALCASLLALLLPRLACLWRGGAGPAYRTPAPFITLTTSNGTVSDVYGVNPGQSRPFLLEHFPPESTISFILSFSRLFALCLIKFDWKLWNNFLLVWIRNPGFWQ